MPPSENVDMRTIVSDGRMGTIIDWNPVDRMYTIALDDDVVVRAWPRDVVVTHVQDIDPPAMLHRDRAAFITGLERIVGAEEEEHEDDVEDEEEAASTEVEQSDDEMAVVSAEDASLCVVCLDEPKTHAIVPCGHVCVCQDVEIECSSHHPPSARSAVSTRLWH